MGSSSPLLVLLSDKFSFHSSSRFHFFNAGFHISTEASLGFVATSLGAGVLLSLMKKSD